MDDLFWIAERELAGRAGPNRRPWSLARLREAGIGAVLSVNDGELCHRDDFDAAGLAYACVPLSENAPPQPGDEEHCLRALPEAHAFVLAQRARGRVVLVHCSSGKDRTGLYGAYYLMREAALDPAAACARVREVRPIAFSAYGWDAFAIRVLSAL